jgi:hypothetical protein
MLSRNEELFNCFRSKGMGTVRDVLEGLARCCLKTHKLDEAKRWALKLVFLHSKYKEGF